MSMLTLELRQDESPDRAMIRRLREEAEGEGGALPALVHHVAALAEHALHKAPGSLHPSVCPLPVDQRMSALARTFPSLEDAGGLDPWDAERFLAWVRGPAPGSGARHAGLFVLGVWNRESFEAHADDLRDAFGLARSRRGFEDPEPITFAEDWPPPATRLRTELAFDAIAALGTWDRAHRAAFGAWASHPWFA